MALTERTDAKLEGTIRLLARAATALEDYRRMGQVPSREWWEQTQREIDLVMVTWQQHAPAADGDPC